MSKKERKFGGKRITGIVIMAISCLIFLLCCFPKFLGIGRFFQGLFGWLAYPLMILLFLVGLALLFNLKYTFKGKYTAYLVFAIISILALLQTIITSKTLSAEAVKFADMSKYLHSCLTMKHGITMGGATLGLIIFPIRALLGLAGTYVFFVITSSIFVGLVIDYIIYKNTRKKRNLAAENPKNWQKTADFDENNNNNNFNYDSEEAYSLEQRLTASDREEEFTTSMFETNTPLVRPETEEAKRKLFDTEISDEEQITPEPQEPKTAHEILFGNRDDVPDMFKRSDEDEPETNEDGSITTSWGTYKPTASFTSLEGNNDDDGVADDEPVIPTRRRGLGSDGIDLIKEEPDDPFSSIFGDSSDTEEETIEPLIRRRRDRSTSSKDVKPEQMSFKNMPAKYEPPSTKLLKEFKEVKGDYTAEYKEKTIILEETLDTFKIPAKVVNVVRGPKVTRYELAMPAGISVTRVLPHEPDLSMALKARHGIRIEAPIPGKNAFGIELENDICSTVGLKELIESPEFTNFKGPLPVPIGKNITGDIIVKSLAKLVHMLVAGSTGSGKSVFLHSVIMSLMFKSSPEDLRFVMIDPKRVEFSRYNRMPHMMIPEIVSDCEKANNVLTWSVKEMERRYDIMVESGCQNIESYNKREEITSGAEKKLPYLVIIVDELAELMTSRMKKDVELKIQRITQLGRAAGIHMVVATQRPSVDVVTGTIKNNLPTRVAFSLSSAVDSKTVIDEGGAEKLLGQGDMLFSAQDSNQKVRLQAAYVTDEEIAATLKYIKSKNISTYDEDIQNQINALSKPADDDEDDSPRGSEDAQAAFKERMDAYMPQALRLVMKEGKASTSLLQRRFSIGYARAAKIIDQMESRGYISESIGNKQREVYITEEQFREQFGDISED